MEISPNQIVLALVAWLLSMFAVYFWPSLGFALFLSIPLVKFSLRMQLPFLTGYTYDMAVIALTAAGVAFHALRSRVRVPGLLPRGLLLAYACLAVLVWVALPYSRAPEYGWKKALWFSVFNTIVFFLPFFYFKRFVDAGRMLVVIALLGAGTMAGLLLFGDIYMAYRGVTRTTLFMANPLAPADMCSYVVIIMFTIWMGQRRLWQLIVAILLIPTSLYAIVLTGTRGPIVAIPVVLLLCFWLYRRTIDFRFVIVGTVLVGAVGMISATILTPEVMTRFATTLMSEALEARIAMFNIALESFLRNPVFGSGTGDTAFQIGGAGFEGYPHNLIIEVAAELGVTGLVAYVILLWYGLRTFTELGRREMENTHAKTVTVPFFGCFLYHFAHAFKTGSFAASFSFYFFMACTIALCRLWQRRGLIDEVETRGLAALQAWLPRGGLAGAAPGLEPSAPALGPASAGGGSP